MARNTSTLASSTVPYIHTYIQNSFSQQKSCSEEIYGDCSKEAQQKKTVAYTCVYLVYMGRHGHMHGAVRHNCTDSTHEQRWTDGEYGDAQAWAGKSSCTCGGAIREDEEVGMAEDIRGQWPGQQTDGKSKGRDVGLEDEPCMWKYWAPLSSCSSGLTSQRHTGWCRITIRSKPQEGKELMLHNGVN